MIRVGDVAIGHKCMGHAKQSVSHARHHVEMATIA